MSAPYPVRLLIAAAMFGKWVVLSFGQQDFGADVSVHGGLPDDGPSDGHFITGGTPGYH